MRLQNSSYEQFVRDESEYSSETIERLYKQGSRVVE